MSKYYDKLSKLKSVELLQILHDCIELLVPVSPAELAKMQGKSKRAIFNQIESGEHMILEYDGRKYPIINDHL